MFLVDVQKAFQAADQVQDAVNRLETLKQGKKTAEELNMEFLQIVGQAGMDRKTPSDHLHLIGYYRKLWNQGLVAKFSSATTSQKWLMDEWRKPSNLTRTGGWKTHFLTQTWGRPHQEKQTPTKAMRMHVGGEQTKGKTLMWWMLTHYHGGKGNAAEARKMLLLQEDRTHGKRLPTRMDLARFAYTMIEVLTKEQRESFMKMVMEDKDEEDFWSREPVWCWCLLLYLLKMYK
jgi:hypothetical protein